MIKKLKLAWKMNPFYTMMIYLDLYTIKSLCLTCKNIINKFVESPFSLTFWKKKYFKDRIPLLRIQTSLISWIHDYKRIQFIISVSSKLIHHLPMYNIHIRYNYEKLKYFYHKEGDNIHQLLLKLLPPIIQKQIIQGNGGKYQELVIYKDDGYKIEYHENYLMNDTKDYAKISSVYSLFIYILYYLPHVSIILYEPFNCKFIKLY